MALGVEIGSIDEVTAPVEKPVDDLLGFLHGRAPAEIFAEGHGAETQRAHAQSGAAERDVVIQWHAQFLVPVPGLSGAALAD